MTENTDPKANFERIKIMFDNRAKNSKIPLQLDEKIDQKYNGQIESSQINRNKNTGGAELVVVFTNSKGHDDFLETIKNLDFDVKPPITDSSHPHLENIEKVKLVLSEIAEHDVKNLKKTDDGYAYNKAVIAYMQ